MAAAGIYVERFIKASLEEIWFQSQKPELHQRWDLRFSRIEYLPRASSVDPQRFLYETRLFGLIAIRGTGESVGQRSLPNGEATSALRFSSEQPWSLIRRGSGYWQYIPVAEGVRFLTWYDYSVRFGFAGRLLDRLILRPAMGWATAWSFDRMRLWVEDSQSPEVSLRLAVVYALCRLTTAFCWLWHGLVPKLWFHDAGERLMLAQAQLPQAMLVWAGGVEIAWGVLLLLFWHRRWMFGANIWVMIAALAGVMLRSPQFLTQAFNPVTLNLCVTALSAAGYAVGEAVPSAASCARVKPAEAL